MVSVAGCTAAIHAIAGQVGSVGLSEDSDSECTPTTFVEHGPSLTLSMALRLAAGMLAAGMLAACKADGKAAPLPVQPLAAAPSW